MNNTIPTKDSDLPRMNTRRHRVYIFRETDGWHWSPKGLDYLDARGMAYPSKAAACRAAKEHYAQPDYPS